MKNKTNIYPNTLIIWVLILLPFSAVSALSESFFNFTLIILVGLVLASVIDFILLNNALNCVTVSVPKYIKLAIDREDKLLICITNQNKLSIESNILPMIPRELKKNCCPTEIQILNNGEIEIEFILFPSRRGIFALEKCHIEFISPLKLWNIRKLYNVKCEMKIYPNLQHNRKALSSVFNKFLFNGMHRQRVIGQGREFEKLREYVHGDSYNIISWKATAKNAKPISKVFQVERTKEIYVVIDTSRLSGRIEQDKPVLEKYLDSALTLASITEQQGDFFGLLTFNHKVNNFIRAKSGKTHFSACRDAIFDCQPVCETPDFETLFSFLRRNLRQRCLLFFLTDLDAPGISESFLKSAHIISKQHLCQVCMMKNSSTQPLFESNTVKHSDEIYEHLAGHLAWDDIEKLRGELHKKNVKLSITDNSKFCVELINDYLTIKQRQLI